MQKSVSTCGFTIIELIAVIAIIGILTGLIVVSIYKMTVSAQIKEAKTTIEQLEAALELYSQNWGTYPNDDGLTNGKFLGGARLLNALESETSLARQRGGPYVKYAAVLKNIYGLLDPFRNPYLYHWSTNSPTVTAVGQAGKSTNITYNIWSSGPDGTNNSDVDGISNPNYPEPLSPEIQKRDSDDIVNW